MLYKELLYGEIADERMSILDIQEIRRFVRACNSCSNPSMFSRHLGSATLSNGPSVLMGFLGDLSEDYD